MNAIVKTLVEKLKAGYPAIYLQTHEDSRAIEAIEQAAEVADRKVYTWLLNRGLVTQTNKGPGVVADTEKPSKAMQQAAKMNEKTVVVLRHFHHYMEDPDAQAAFLALIPEFKKSKRHIILTSPVVKLPPELEKEFSLIEMPLPTRDELLGIVDSITSSDVGKPSDEIRLHLAEAARGLTVSEAENAIALAGVKPNLNEEGVPKKGKAIEWGPNVVLDEKCETVKKSQMLTYYPASGKGLDQIGGMVPFKQWITRRAAIFKDWDAAMKFGCDIPKGVFAVGVSGTGKSLGARATSDAFGLPLIRVDMGSIFGGIVGQSESNARAVIKFLEAVSPCVGWLDEIEKGFAGSSGGQLDSGVGARVLGTFLTWMQEKTAPVFIYATANNVAALPPELLRKGRFDEMFYVALPNRLEREEIFKIHIAKRNRAHMIGKQIDVSQLAEMTKGYSGAEIEAVVKDSIEEAFTIKKDLNMFDMQEAIQNIVPLSKLMKEEIEALENWSKGRARPANAPEQFIGKAPGLGREISV